MTAPPPYRVRPSTPRTLGTLAVVFGLVVATMSLMTVVSGARIASDDLAPEAVAQFEAATRAASLATALVLLVMSLALAFIGGGLRRYERWAVPSALRWSLGALLIVGVLTYVNAVVIGPAAAALFASTTDADRAALAGVMRWAGVGTPLVYAPFPVVLFVNLRRPHILAAMDQPVRRLPAR
ncbi:MAG: hypothetical protein R3B06_17455 [Kofleriaceae bacterium]